MGWNDHIYNDPENEEEHKPMNTTDKATARPWKYDKEALTIWEDRDYEIQGDGPDEVANHVDPDNAELIVKAVNMHHELVSALENLFDYVNDDIKQIPCINKAMVVMGKASKALRNAGIDKSALAKAKEA